MPIFGFTNIPGSVITQTSVAIAQGTDADAQAYIDAASITDSTQISAVNQLVLDLKSYNIWTKMKAIYPVLGGSASSHAVNLITPGTYNLTFSTGWTHASTGMTPNGTSAYAATGIIPNSHLTNNSTHMSYYSRTNTNIAAASFDMGINGSSTASYFDMSLRLSDTFYSDQYNTTTNRLTTANTNSTGFYITSRTTSTSLKSYKNGTQIGSTLTNASSGFSGLIYGIYIGAINNNNLNAQFFTNREGALISIGDGLDDTESANFNTAVQAFQTTLSRNV